MAFQSLKNFLRGGSSKLDRLEKRIRRIEYELSRISFNSQNQGGQGKEVKTQRSLSGQKEDLSRKGSTVYTNEGWKVPRKSQTKSDNIQKSSLPSKVGAKERLMLEFECPQCGSINNRGIKHSHVDNINSHTDYHLYFKCNNCGWESDLVSIRATN